MALNLLPSTSTPTDNVPAEFLSNYYCSYGWVPGAPTTYSSSTPPPSGLATTGLDRVVVAQNPTTPSSIGDYALLGVGVVAGVIALGMIIRETLKSRKH